MDMPLARKLGFTILPAAFVVPLLMGLSARAQEPPPAPPPGVRGEMLNWFQDAEKKLVELAAATPEAKYAWRPGKDVRSTGEVFMHVARANYGLPRFAGVKPPEGINFETFEKSLTRKADIEKALKDSFAHMKKGFMAMSDADLDKPTEFFGNKSTYRGVYLLLLSHAHEHLGQSIAYARMNKITPPWTERNNERKQKGNAKPS
jgi:uncharacterized damage-inducible protein DinB